ncbi:MAG TPA: replicative DNA helicase [Kofleriaceae bacterium]
MARDRRVLPHNLDAEASILGGILLRNDVLLQLETLEIDDFYHHQHKVVFEAIRNLEAAAKPVDVVTLENEIEKKGKLEAIGGIAFLGELAMRVPTTDNILAYSEIVKDHSQARKLILASSEISEKGYEDGLEIKDYLDDAEAKIFEVTQRKDKTGPEPLKGLVKKVFSSLDERFKQADGITGLPTGFTDLDGKTAGLQPTELIILAARPAMGKTSFALSLAQNAATSGNWPCLVFSLEMSSTQLAERMLCSEARVDSSALRRGQLQRQDMTNLTYAAATLSKAPILIDDSPALSLREVRARARRWRSDPSMFPRDGTAKKCGLILVDYLQLMRGSPQAAKASREQEISEISRGLKSLAKELDCPVLALSQLNRSLEQRTDKRPQLSDLRECVTGDTLVALADGRHVPIASLVGTTPEVIAMAPNCKLVTATSDKVWLVGKKSVFDVRLASGRSIRCTAKHRLYGADGWKRLEELAIGERLAIARTLPESAQRLRWSDLLRLGIVGRVREIAQGRHRSQFPVDINGADQQRLFLDLVGASGPRVAQAESLRALLDNQVANTNVDTLPQEVFVRVQALMSQQGISQRAMAAARGTSYGGTSHVSFAPSRKVVGSYAEILDDDLLRDQATNDLFWDRIVSIDAAGEEDVFDLTVPGPASWLANGSIVSHNSGAIEQDADVIMFIYRDVVYNKDCENPHIAEVILGKNRHGATGTVETHFEGRFTRFENLAHRNDGPPPGH